MSSLREEGLGVSSLREEGLGVSSLLWTLAWSTNNHDGITIDRSMEGELYDWM